MNSFTTISKKWLLRFLLGPVLVMAPFHVFSVQAKQDVSISTGSTSGVYYKAGLALCNLYSRAADQNGVGCRPRPTAGSVENLGLLRSGDDAFAIVQSDIQFQAYIGVGQFSGRGKFGELRSLFSLHPETVTVLVARKSGITRPEGLLGRRFGNGSVGSGSRLASDQLFEANTWDKKKFALLSSASPIEAGAMLCSGRLDAFLVVMGHPADTIRVPIEQCGARLVPMVGPAVDALVRDHRYLVRSAIPGGLYRNHAQPIQSYGPLAVVVTTATTPSDTVYRLVRAVFENLPEFKKQNASLAGLNFWDMISAGLTAPLHDGAVRYYREKGWIK